MAQIEVCRQMIKKYHILKIDDYAAKHSFTS